MNEHRRTSGVWSGVAAAVLAIFCSAAPAWAGEEFTPPKPLPACTAQPAYPDSERRAGIEGTVLLRVEVKVDGTVGAVTAEQEVAGHPAFTTAATAAVSKWCFEPARANGKVVAASVAIPVRFALSKKKSS